MAAQDTLRPQDVLDDYWVGKELGTGARTTIHEIKRKEDGAVFALKFIPVRGEEDLHVIEHLENEYNVLTAIQEQRTTGVGIAVRAIDFQKVRKWFKVKAAYLMMERLVGRALSDYNEYDLAEVLTIFRQVGLGLENTHSAGYVHADLKPQNILVGEHLDVKLIDFGFAAPIGTKLTSYKGTFGYLAPEQAGGRVTGKTDVFNMAAALYWVLTGENVPSIMPGEHERMGFVPGEGVKIPPPSRLNPDVPDELSGMVLKCLEFDPNKRPTVTQVKRYLHGLQLRLDYTDEG